MMRKSTLLEALGILGLPLIASCTESYPEGGVSVVANSLQEEPDAIDLGLGDPGSGIVSRQPVHATVSVLDPEALRELDAMKSNDGAAASGLELSPSNQQREAILSRAASTDPDVELPLMFVLPDRPFKWRSLADRSLTNDARQALVDSRVADIRTAYHAAFQTIAAVALEEPTTLWLVPAIHARLRARHVPAVLALPESIRVYIDEPGPKKYEASYSGLEVRSGVRASDFLNHGHTGSSGGAAGGAIRLGIYDSRQLLYNHAGFRDQFGYARWERKWKCSATSCWTYVPSQVDEHGTIVAAAAAGSIDQGQDPSYTTVTSRAMRGGVATQADLYYYADDESSEGTWAGEIQTMSRAVLDGVEVLNHSYSYGGSPSCNACDPACDGAGYVQAQRNARDAGLINVSALGNNGDPGYCNAYYPGVFRAGLTVAGLDSVTAATYDSLPIWSSSARGGMSITVGGTVYPGSVSIADISAPACRDYLYNTGGYGVEACGTSIAAPIVAGAVAVTKDALHASGITLDAGMLMSMMLLQGDGWNAVSGQKAASGMSYRSGAGRLHMWYPSGEDLVAPWNWGCHEFDIANGQVFSFSVGDSGPESSSITQWKLAMTFDEPSLTSAADVDVRVYNTCPPGGGAAVIVGADTSRDIRSRMMLSAGSIGGKCLEYRINGYYVPPSQTRRVYVCDYYHSGNPNDH